MKKVLITGAGSYIGSSVEQWLLKYPGKYSVDTLDMRDQSWKEYDFSPYDVVFHVAGLAHADVGNVAEEIKQKYYAVNTDLAVETAGKSKESHVKQFIFMSSMIVYGRTAHIMKETEPVPENFYGDSKWKADKGIRELGDASFHVAVLRPPMIYGSNSKGNYRMLSKMAGRLPVFPKINNRRSMLYVDNLCEFIRLLIDHEEAGIFFPQNEELVNTSALVKQIAEAKGHKIWVTRLLAPMVWAGRVFPGKIGGMCRKAFGDSYYDPELSVYRYDYRVCGFRDSVLGAEGHGQTGQKI